MFGMHQIYSEAVLECYMQKQARPFSDIIEMSNILLQRCPTFAVHLKKLVVMVFITSRRGHKQRNGSVFRHPEISQLLITPWEQVGIKNVLYAFYSTAFHGTKRCITMQWIGTPLDDNGYYCGFIVNVAALWPTVYQIINHQLCYVLDGMRK